MQPGDPPLGWPNEPPQKITIGKIIVYAICAIVFGLFLLWNVYACVAPFVLLSKSAGVVPH